MKVYFTCSTAELKKYRESYFAIRQYLLDKGHILTRDWLPEAERRLNIGETSMQDVRDIYKACMSALKEADLVIIEDTVSNFSTGHQISSALRLGKPTLVLWQGRKRRSFDRMFIHGLRSDVLEVAEYTNRNLTEVLQVFIGKYDETTEKNQFHLVLGNAERRYLDWSQLTKGDSRTKVIRELLREAMEADEGYREYLVGRD